MQRVSNPHLDRTINHGGGMLHEEITQNKTSLTPMVLAGSGSGRGSVGINSKSDGTGTSALLALTALWVPRRFLEVRWYDRGELKRLKNIWEQWLL